MEVTMSEIGTQAPDFSLVDQYRQQVTLNQYRGKKNVVLSFHILSFTGGWTDQISLFRAANSKFEGRDTQVLGISADAGPSQTAYSVSLGNLPYPLLSDFYPHGEVAKLYGLFNDKNGTSKRAVVIIDKNGVIRVKHIYAKADDIDISNILNDLETI